MANQGMYRAGPAPGGLPLPRQSLTGFTIAIVLLAIATLVVAPALLGVFGGSPSGAWRLFRDGGALMWALVLLLMTMPVVVALVGALAVRGRRVPTALLFSAAALPLAVALLAAWSTQRIVIGAISGESVDPEQKARILAEGVAESMAADIFGGLVACGIAIAAAAAAACVVASIDASAASRSGLPPDARPRSGMIGTLIAGALWLVATLVVSFVRLRAAGGIVVLPVLAVVALVPFAALAARRAWVLRAWHDPAEARRVAGALVVALLAALLAVLALQRAVEASFTSRALQAIAGETVDPSQRAAVLAEAVAAGSLGTVAYAMHVLLGGATFGLALAPALGGGRHPMTPSAAMAVVLGVLLVAGAFGLAHARAAAPARVAAGMRSAPPGVTLPVVIDAFSHKGASPGYGTERIVLGRDGSGEGTDNGGCSSAGAGRRALYADRAATMAMLHARFGLYRGAPCPRRVVFVATRRHPPEMEARLGWLAGFLGSTSYLEATLDGGGDANERHGATMRVRSLDDGGIEVDGARIAFPPTSPGPRGPRDERAVFIDYTFRPTDTVERVVDVITQLEIAYASRTSWDLERAIEIDDGLVAGAVAAASASAPTGIGLGSLGSLGGVSALRGGAPSVNGRLPPEVIQRIVRQNFGRMRLCYQNGLVAHPDLEGRVSVKFVIDRDGAVKSAASSGSTLPDDAVVQCVVRAFNNLSFPQPEGGVVTVVYPIDFTHQ